MAHDTPDQSREPPRCDERDAQDPHHHAQRNEGQQKGDPKTEKASNPGAITIIGKPRRVIPPMMSFVTSIRASSASPQPPGGSA